MLAAREKTLDLNQIGRWPAPKNSAFPFSDVIEAWAKAKEFEGVVWAALEPGFPKQRGQVPTLDQLLENLEHLKGQNLADAIEYVEKTPVQIKTAHRPALEKALALPSENPAPVAVSFQGNVELPNDNLSNDNIPPDPPDVFLTRLVEKLSGQDGIDRDLASILASSILKAAPSKDAVEDAFSKIKKLAETRAAPVQEALDG
ncbi:hypothetical protein [Mesorhizobium sp. B1-1-7]|uniref:hypothetical protein n=1 Tax=Mesorhizobium sp. B1-1-7 TaxID=2589977 RepID=UPI00112A2C95|nr:hypothetical protein [Mesorhizobium sp. B1-1-7]TPN42811.1 hypothetical protein FJ978_32195 [Mesorhizobium sp. B1-1-7]